MKAVAAERLRFGYRRIHIMLDRQGIVTNLKTLRRLYGEERLQVRKRGGRKRALGTRRPMVVPQAPFRPWEYPTVRICHENDPGNAGRPGPEINPRTLPNPGGKAGLGAASFRDDDIVIATYAKSGTTWMQQIIGQLVFDGAEGIPTAVLSPLVDLRIPPRQVKLPEIEAQTHWRFLKTHLPVDALVFSPQAKYIYVGRDPRDVVWSLFNHRSSANQLWYDALNGTLDRVGPEIGRPPADPVTCFRDWLANDGAPF